MIGNGYWLNPRNGKWIIVRRHEIAVLDPKAMDELGVRDELIHITKQHDPAEVWGNPLHLTKEQEDEVRLLGIKAGLVRIRDYGNYISVQFNASPHGERRILQRVAQFLDDTDEWRPQLHVGNLQTNEFKIYNKDELIQYILEDIQDIPNNPVIMERLNAVLKRLSNQEN